MKDKQKQYKKIKKIIHKAFQEAQATRTAQGRAGKRGASKTIKHFRNTLKWLGGENKEVDGGGLIGGELT